MRDLLFFLFFFLYFILFNFICLFGNVNTSSAMSTFAGDKAGFALQVLIHP